jgi:hypothetical protein
LPDFGDGRLAPGRFQLTTDAFNVYWQWCGSVVGNVFGNTAFNFYN